MYSGLKIGSVFTLIGILVHFTVIGAILFVGLTFGLFESISSAILKGADYKTIVNLTIGLVTSVFIASTTSFLIHFVKRIKSKKDFPKARLMAYFGFQFFIVHTLLYLIILSQNLHWAKDGQFIFSFGGYLIYSSFYFIVFGATLDLIKKQLLTQG